MSAVHRGILCEICPAHCTLQEGQRSRCNAREAHEGRIVDRNHGRVTALALDPIEKKPLAEYKPGSRVLSVGSYGCNLRCPFCQNASIACGTEDTVPWRSMSPEELVELARELRSEGNIGVAFTYNEPLVGFEFVRDTALLVHEAGMDNVLVSNGCVREEPFRELLPLIDAANIDLKSFDAAFYRNIGGDLDAVKRTIELMVAALGCHGEVTTLVVPGISDDPVAMEEMTAWLASLDPDIPYHLSRFFPHHKMSDVPPTPQATMREMAAIARQRLNRVYLGNM